VSRSDYGHLRSVLDGIRRAPDLELILLVAGMHLAPEFGDTLREIEADGFHIAERIEMLDNADTPEAVAISTGRGGEGFARAVAGRRPELVVVLGDRFEMLAAAVAAPPVPPPAAPNHRGRGPPGRA